MKKVKKLQRSNDFKSKSTQSIQPPETFAASELLSRLAISCPAFLRPVISCPAVLTVRYFQSPRLQAGGQVT